MIMNEQVLSIEQMQYLTELGIDTSKASMIWRLLPECFRIPEEHYVAVRESSEKRDDENIPTFTLQDAIDLIPRSIDTSNELRVDLHDNSFSYWWVGGICDNKPVVHFASDRLITSAYEMICWLAENGYLNKK